MGKLPLEGIRVIDFSWVLSGPTCTLWLSTLGAEVIKIESTTRPDTTRSAAFGAFQGVPGLNRGSIFNTLHYGKKSCTLNMTRPEAVELAKQLIKKSDVVVDSYAYGVMEKFGLGYDVLKELKPDLVVLSKSTLGRTGPDKHHFGFGTAVLSYTGLASVTGYQGGEPEMAGAAWPDYVLGAKSAFAVMAALYNRAKTGEGQFIDFSMCEATAAMVPDALMDYTLNGRVREPQGNKDEAAAPHNTYRCMGNDKWIAIAVTNDDEWRALCRVIGREEWLKDERFADAYSRWLHQEELDRLIEEWTKQRTPQEAMEALQKAGVPAGPSYNVEDLVNDPHLRERGFLVDIDHAETGPIPMPGLPVHYSATQLRYGPSPLIGEHNQYIFGDLLGLGEDEVGRLLEEKVIL